MTQILFYLGDLTQRGAEPKVNLDMAKHQIDILGVLEEKSRGTRRMKKNACSNGAV